MSPNEYKELTDFLSKKFGRIDQRFDRMDQRFERMDQRFDRMDQRFERVEERLTRVELLGEQNQSSIQTVAELVTTVDRKVEALRAETSQGFVDVRAEMKAGFDRLNARVSRLEKPAA